MNSTVRLQRVSAYDAEAQEAAVTVIEEAFYPRESACLACGVADSPQAVRELNDLVRVALRDGVSVAAYLGDAMVGVAVNKIQVRPPPGDTAFFEVFRNERAQDPRAKWLLDFMQRVDAMTDLFAEAGGDPILEVMFLGVRPEAGARGVGLQMVNESLVMAREVAARGVSAIWTSDRSRAIGRRLGFKELVTAEHSTFFWEGKPISEKLPDFQQRSVLAIHKMEGQ